MHCCTQTCNDRKLAVWHCMQHIYVCLLHHEVAFWSNHILCLSWHFLITYWTHLVCSERFSHTKHRSSPCPLNWPIYAYVSFYLMTSPVTGCATCWRLNKYIQCIHTYWSLPLVRSNMLNAWQNVYKLQEPCDKWSMGCFQRSIHLWNERCDDYLEMSNLQNSCLFTVEFYTHVEYVITHISHGSINWANLT